MTTKHFKDDLIILKRFCINENDLLVTAFGRMSGKIQLKAKGSKKLLSKFTGRLEPLNLIQAEIYNSGKSYTLTTSHLKCDNLFQSDLATFNLSQKICLILNKNIPFEEAHPELFSLLENLIKSLSNINNCRLKTELFFLTKFLKLTGILPYLTECHTCHQKLNQSAYFQEHHIVCQNCKTSEYQKINFNTIKLINYINNLERVEQLRPIKVPTQIQSESTKILISLFNS